MDATSWRGSARDAVGRTLLLAVAWAMALGSLPCWPNGEFLAALLAAPVAGLLIGAAQWVMTTRRLGASAWWAPAYAAGWWAGLVVAIYTGTSWFAPDPIRVGSVGGAAAGLLQWVTLRRHLRLAWCWVPASAIISLAACVVGYMAGDLSWRRIGFPSPYLGAYLIGSATVGLISGSLTELSMALLARLQGPGAEPAPARP